MKHNFTAHKQDRKATEQSSRMKATTWVRVILPTDELVRMECAATMTVGDLVSELVERDWVQNSDAVTMNRERGTTFYDDNNRDTDPTAELSLGWRTTGRVPNLSQGKLTLVRMEAELEAGALVVDEVNNYDILEFQIAGTDALQRVPESKYQQSRGGASPVLKLPPRTTIKAVRSVPMTDIPLQHMQSRTREELATHRGSNNEAGPLTPPAFDSRQKIKTRGSIQRSIVRRSALRRRGARKCPFPRNKQNVRQFSGSQAHRQRTRVLKHVDRILLQAGMQLIECVQVVQKNVCKLVFLLRDAVLGGSSLCIEDLLTLARTMVNVLTHTGVDSTADTSTSSDDTRKDMVRRLSRDIAGKDGGVMVLAEGWVVTAEWGTFWRSQRREYACLCDNHVLYFFTSQTHCADFVFELGRERHGTTSEISKHLLKENSPLNQIDLSETDWTVRKSVQEEERQHRNAFAFFDPHGRMRLVLDVGTATEAAVWARLISAEISQNKLFARMCASANVENEDHTDSSNPLVKWIDIMTQTSNPIAEQHPFMIPLHSLYSHIDRRNGAARAERYRSWTLCQALKDLQRDRVKINGVVHAGASLETNILALTLEILKCTSVDPDATVKTRLRGTITSIAKEMMALRFAHQVITCSSRTHGGGDILDTLHLLFGISRYCICPDASSMEPIEINVSKSASKKATLMAQITMKMVYRVISADSIGSMDNQTFVTNCAANSLTQDTGVEQREIAEFKILGIYSQRLKCHFVEDKSIQGSVQLQLAGDV